MKFIYPLIILFGSLAIIYTHQFYFDVSNDIDYFHVAVYATASFIMLIALFVTQKVVENREVYWFLLGGSTFIFFSLLTDTLNEFYLYPKGITDIFIDFFRLIGVGFIIVAILKWIKENEHLKVRLLELASTDDLTGLLNRRIFNKEAVIEFEKSKRHNRILSLIVIDLDNFKQINDTYGHFFGDLVLKSFAKKVSKHIRLSDMFCRWGGDEFTILLSETGEEEARRIAEKIRSHVKEIKIPTDNAIIQFTVSIGIATHQPSDGDIIVLTDRADKALYLAKQEGRDRIRIG